MTYNTLIILRVTFGARFMLIKNYKNTLQERFDHHLTLGGSSLTN
jgi:hypothetical protein